jgi:periplasmic divalent cation tolerance protein
MNNPQDIIVVLTTAPDLESAKKLARPLLENNLAACVNILQGLSSLYHWEGKLQDDREVQLFIKTRAELLDEKIIPLIQKHHPYDLPEILALPVVGGSESYLEWVLNETDQELDR